MARLCLTLVLTVLMLTVAGPAATAHELQVVAPGSVRLDAGTAAPARLVHATLLDPGDRLVVTVAASDAPVEALLLVPDRRPERGRAGDALPAMQVPDAAEASVVVLEEPRRVRDEATGFDYLVLATVDVPRSTEVATVTVARGSEPTRVALRVGRPGAPFRSSDPERTPRGLILARGWVETEPAGAGDLPEGWSTAPGRTVAWFAAALAAAGLLVAAWWVARGRAASRRRGVERAVEERPAHAADPAGPSTEERPPRTP